MSVSLEKILKRNKSNLLTFIAKNKLTSYDSLVEYCKMRGFIPCEESEYKAVLPKEKKNEVKKPSRKNSSTQKKRKPRNSNKTEQTSQRVLGSNDDGKN